GPQARRVMEFLEDLRERRCHPPMAADARGPTVEVEGEGQRSRQGYTGQNLVLPGPSNGAVISNQRAGVTKRLDDLRVGQVADHVSPIGLGLHWRRTGPRRERGLGAPFASGQTS